MAGELNTEVVSDPASCRATAVWLGTLSPQVHEAGSAVYGARGGSESCWEGTAADAFRAAMTPIGQDADELVRIIDRVRAALDAFAGDIDTVLSRLEQARSVAAAARLIVTPTAILPPGPGPGAAPTHPMGPMNPPAEAAYADSVRAHAAAAAAHEAKVAAFNEARATVDEARRMEATAHSTLDAAMDENGVKASTLKTVAVAAMGAGLGTIAGLQTASNDLLRAADRISEHGNRMQALAAEATAAQATRAAAARAADAAKAGEARIRGEAGRLQQPIRAIPEPVRQGVGASPGDWVKDGNSWTKLGRSAGRGVPFVGTGLTITSGGVDIAMGKPVGEVAAETGASIGGGVAGGLTGAAIGSAIFPGPGTVIGGIVGGIAGSMVATESVKHAMGD